MINEAIILAGGLGTRLKHLVADIPKPMLEVNGKPFLAYALDYLIEQGIKKTILSVGHNKGPLMEFFGDQYKSLALTYAMEEEPLGTGGAIKNALKYAGSKNVFVLNGDTLFPVDLQELVNTHKAQNADLTIALKPLQDFDRYGTVEVDAYGKITGFEEKKHKENGLINGGIYLLRSQLLTELQLPEKFSFEKDVMERYPGERRFYGIRFDDYFIDIGIPEDYEKAQKELG